MRVATRAEPSEAGMSTRSIRTTFAGSLGHAGSAFGSAVGGCPRPCAVRSLLHVHERHRCSPSHCREASLSRYCSPEVRLHGARILRGRVPEREFFVECRGLGPRRESFAHALSGSRHSHWPLAGWCCRAGRRAPHSGGKGSRYNRSAIRCRPRAAPVSGASRRYRT